MGDWRERAICRDIDTAVFFPVPVGSVYRSKRDDRYDDAVAFCDGCPVKARCLIEHLDETEGVFGGTVPQQRERIRAARARRPGPRPRRPPGVDDPSLSHGSRGGYVRGCGCDPCRDASNAYERDRYARARSA